MVDHVTVVYTLPAGRGEEGFGDLIAAHKPLFALGDGFRSKDYLRQSTFCCTLPIMVRMSYILCLYLAIAQYIGIVRGKSIKWQGKDGIGGFGRPELT